MKRWMWTPLLKWRTYMGFDIWLYGVANSQRNRPKALVSSGRSWLLFEDDWHIVLLHFTRYIFVSSMAGTILQEKTRNGGRLGRNYEHAWSTMKVKGTGTENISYLWEAKRHSMRQLGRCLNWWWKSD
jgi:hypothetical protein